MLKIVENVLEKKLKEIIHILQMNQPPETSRVVSLVKQELDPIKDHLKQQDKKLEEMDRKIDLLRPVSEFVRFSKLFRKGFLWITPLGGILLAIYKFIIKDLR